VRQLPLLLPVADPQSAIAVDSRSGQAAVRVAAGGSQFAVSRAARSSLLQSKMIAAPAVASKLPAAVFRPAW